MSRYSIQNPYNIQQKRNRLLREINYFKEKTERLCNPSSPQEKRNSTRALRCLKRRERDLVELTDSNINEVIK